MKQFKESRPIKLFDDEIHCLRKEISELKNALNRLKNNHHLFKTKIMIFELIESYKNEFSVEKMANLLGVSRSGYYAFIKKGTSTRELENERLKKKIKQIHISSKGTYGSTKMHAIMKNDGETCSRKRVSKLMRQDALKTKVRE